MKRIFSILGMLLSFVSCSWMGEGISTRHANEFEALLKNGDLQLVDARTAAEFAEGHIDGAVNIDVLQPDFLRKAKAQLSRERPVGIYCRSGKRSMMGAEKLRKAHFKVVNLHGGILEWQQAGKPVRR